MFWWVIIGVLAVVGLFIAYMLYFNTLTYRGRHAAPGRPALFRARVRKYLDDSLVFEEN